MKTIDSSFYLTFDNKPYQKLNALKECSDETLNIF